MKELWLKYTNENGEHKRVSVNAEKFFIGRHSENDLCIPKNQLSRRHAEIDRYEDVFVISDSGSSNGTKINKRLLERPTALENGDKINLGGGAEITVELISVDQKNAPLQPSPEKAAENESAAQAEIAPNVSGKDFVPAFAQTEKPKKSGLGIFLILAPILVLVILLFVGLILVLSGTLKGNDISQNSDKSYVYSDGDEDEKPNKKKKDEKNELTNFSSKSDNNKQSASVSPTTNSVSNSSTDSKNNATVPPVSGENDTIEKDALSLLRRIAKTDPNPVLTQKQIGEINAAVKTFKGSAALRDNLQSLKKNSGQIEALAKSKNLRAQFLATAALAKIGNARGDALATAQSIAGDLNELSNLIANDVSDDSLMIIAAFQEGGAASKMPSMLANLTKSSPSDARRIRTIWFLHDNGKISEAQYQFALRFLAIGTITQNPKDFNVEAEAVIFN